MNLDILQAAHDLLLEAKATKLPLNAEKLAKKLGICVLPADETLRETISELELDRAFESAPAFSIFSDKDKFIFYSPTLTIDQKQNYIAHELGHFKLHRDRYQGGILQNAEILESEADEFMRHIRAPLPVLSKMRVSSAEEVEEITHLDRYSSTLVYDDLLEYETLLNSHKQQVINQKKTQKQLSRSQISRWIQKHKTVLACVLVFLVTTSFFVFGSYISKFNRFNDAPIQTETPQETTQRIPEDAPALPSTTPCYWTASGEVYHLYKDCYHIKNSKIIQGSISEAKQFGKSEFCKTCKARS